MPPAKNAVTHYRIALCAQSHSRFNVTDEGYFSRGFSIKPRHPCCEIAPGLTAAAQDSFCSQANEQGVRFPATQAR
jgi:hypothetical protein